jgi:hypothetical protein
MEPDDDATKWNKLESDPDPRLLLKIQDRIASSLTPVRPVWPAWALQLLFVLLFVLLVAGFSFVFGTHGFHALTTPRRWAFFSILTAGAWLTSVSLTAEMTPGSLRRFHRLGLAGGILLTFSLVAAILLPVDSATGFIAYGMPCFSIGCIVGGLAALAAWQFLRSGFIASELSAQITAATFSGIVATTVLEIHCDRLFLFHVLVWHLAPFLFAGLTVAVAGALWRRLKVHSNIVISLLCPVF